MQKQEVTREQVSRHPLWMQKQEVTREQVSSHLLLLKKQLHQKAAREQVPRRTLGGPGYIMCPRQVFQRVAWEQVPRHPLGRLRLQMRLQEVPREPVKLLQKSKRRVS